MFPNIPFTTKYGEEYKLRPLVSSDEEKLCEYANNTNVARQLQALPSPYSRTHAQSFIEHCSKKATNSDGLDSFPDSLVLAISYQGSFIGVIGVDLGWNLEGFPVRSGNMGYWLAEQYWGKGIMATAAQHLVAYCFETLPSLNVIDLEARSGNLGSNGVALKTGFVLQGNLKNHFLPRFQDQLDNVNLYSFGREPASIQEWHAPCEISAKEDKLVLGEMPSELHTRPLDTKLDAALIEQLVQDVDKVHSQKALCTHTLRVFPTGVVPNKDQFLLEYHEEIADDLPYNRPHSSVLIDHTETPIGVVWSFNNKYAAERPDAVPWRLLGCWLVSPSSVSSEIIAIGMKQYALQLFERISTLATISAMTIDSNTELQDAYVHQGFVQEARRCSTLACVSDDSEINFKTILNFVLHRSSSVVA